MNTLTEAIEDYLRLRHALGFKLYQVQLDFAAFMEQKAAPFITIECALEWAMLPAQAHPSHWAKRLTAIRLFARCRSAIDPRTEVPPSGLLPHKTRRANPYLYTEEDISRLMRAASALPPSSGLRGKTYCCLFGLLAVTGLRIGEALALKVRDVDLQTGVLTIRKAKFDKSRLVPVHSSTQTALSTFAQLRDRHIGHLKADHFLVSARGRPLVYSCVRKTFHGLRRQIGLEGSAHCDTPQLHHFRHRFAMETLLQWYRSGEDVERRLLVLSTFLGHSRISETYRYLSARPELMDQAVRRIEQRWEESP